MIRLEITGEDAAEFHRNAIQTLAAIAGMRAKPAASPPETPQTEPVTVEAVAEPAAEPDPFPASDDVSEAPTKPEPKKRGRPAKAADAPAEETAKVEIKVDDIRNRVRDVISGFKTTLDKDDEKAEAKAVAYTSKLFALFDMKKVSDLPAERYAEFMATSESWLEGKQA